MTHPTSSALGPMLAALLLPVAPAAAGTPPGRYAPVGALRIYYERHGAPRAGQPPLVLLHGGGSTLETSFATLLPSLAKDRQVIAFDQQGHGRTADVDRPFGFEQSADDAAALLAHLGIPQADFFGYSNGASIALQIAIRHPRLVRRLVVASPMFRRDAMPPAFWEGMRHATLESMPAELRDAYVKSSPHPERLASFHAKSVQRMLQFRDWPPELIRGIEAPTLVMNGDADVTRPEHALELFRLLPHARLAVLPGTDHASIVGSPGVQVSMIRAFLDEPSPGAR